MCFQDIFKFIDKAESKIRDYDWLCDSIINANYIVTDSTYSPSINSKSETKCMQELMRPKSHLSSVLKEIRCNKLLSESKGYIDELRSVLFDIEYEKISELDRLYRSIDGENKDKLKEDQDEATLYDSRSLADNKLKNDKEYMRAYRKLYLTVVKADNELVNYSFRNSTEKETFLTSDDRRLNKVMFTRINYSTIKKMVDEYKQSSDDSNLQIFDELSLKLSDYYSSKIFELCENISSSINEAIIYSSAIVRDVKTIDSLNDFYLNNKLHELEFFPHFKERIPNVDDKAINEHISNQKNNEKEQISINNRLLKQMQRKKITSIVRCMLGTNSNEDNNLKQLYDLEFSDDLEIDVNHTKAELIELSDRYSEYINNLIVVRNKEQDLIQYNYINGMFRQLGAKSSNDDYSNINEEIQYINDSKMRKCFENKLSKKEKSNQVKIKIKNKIFKN